MPERPAVPQDEITTLVMACAEAADLADEGQVEDGYQRLYNGFERAMALRVMRHEPWAEELIRRWDAAIKDYRQLYDPPSG